MKILYSRANGAKRRSGRKPGARVGTSSSQPIMYQASKYRICSFERGGGAPECFFNYNAF